MGMLGCQHDQHASVLDVALFQPHESAQMSVDDIENPPQSFNEAVAGPEKNQWTPSTKSELKSLRDRGAFTVEKLPPGVRPVSTKWAFKKKVNCWKVRICSVYCQRALGER